MARGSVFRRSGGWAYRIDVGFQPGNGSRRQALKQGFATKKAAELAMAEALSASAKGMAVSRSTLRVADFLNEWLVPARSRLRPTTYYSYEVAVGRINAHLGRHQLQSLTPMQIEKFYATQLESGGRAAGALAPKTVRNTHVVLRKALSDAERLGLVPRNAAASVRPPTSVRPDLITWSSAELREFVAAVKDDRMRVAFVLLATTGMRRGEVLGLRWTDVDFDGSQLSVAHTLTTAGSEVVTGPPKTARSRRHVYLDKQTLSVLREHRKQQREERLAAGPAWDSSVEFVVRDELGAPVHPDWFSREFNRIVRSIDLPHIRLHDLRHTYATLALRLACTPRLCRSASVTRTSASRSICTRM